MARILITDDEAPLRALMGDVLRHMGHTVVEARTARDALAAHCHEPADLIVTDMIMPDMDGTELLRRVRAASPHTPIIGISGATRGRIYLGMARILGAECVLAKPFTPDEFATAVHETLAASEQARACRTPEAERVSVSSTQ